MIALLSTHTDHICQPATGFGIINWLLKCQICQQNLHSDKINFLLCFMEIKR